MNQPVVTQPDGHAKYAPSDAARWMNCPGAIALTGDTESPDSVYSAEGTNAHVLLEKCLKEARRADEFIGQVVFTPHPDFPELSTRVEAEMAAHINTVLDYIETRFFEAFTDEQPTLYSETRVVLRHDCHGTMDVGLYWPKNRTLEVLDLKYGSGSMVEASHPQQGVYCSAFCHQMALRGDALDKVIATIAQPRGFHPGGPVRSFTRTYDELDTFTDSIWDAIDAAEAKEALLVPGDEQCKWCAVRDTCSARAEIIMDDAVEIFKSLSEPPTETLTPDDVFYITNGDAIIEKINAIKNKLMAQILDGGPGHGYKCVAGRANRRWTETDAVILKVMRTDFKFKKGELVTEKLVGIPAIEKLVKSRKPDMMDKLKGYIEKPTGNPKLVTDDNPGEPMVRNAEGMFEAVPSTDEAPKEKLEFLH